MVSNDYKYNDGITSEVFTTKSNLKLNQVIEFIIDKKALAIFNWVESLNKNSILYKEDFIVVVGAYLTGVGISKLLISKGYSNVVVVDIYPHLENLINSDRLFSLESNCVNFSSNLDLICDADFVIDLTGFGGLNEEQSSKINSKAFLIENPIGDCEDKLLSEKNNIFDRLKKVNSTHKSFLKTEGLNTKTSGTMTILVEVLKRAIDEAIKLDGVLYSACEMTFLEDIIFKEKDIDKFFDCIDKSAMKVSTIKPFNCDYLLMNLLNKLYSEVYEYDI